MIKGCRIKTCEVEAGDTHRVMVKLYPGEPPEEGIDLKEYDFERKVGESYTIHAPSTFPVDEDPRCKKENSVMYHHQIYVCKSFVRSWQITMVKNAKGLDAPLVCTHYPLLMIFPSQSLAVIAAFVYILSSHL